MSGVQISPPRPLPIETDNDQGLLGGPSSRTALPSEVEAGDSAHFTFISIR
jgi:hypothetical protein